jgi:D-alanine-D-alanine ligase-like ATP-grasp enzyme
MKAPFPPVGEKNINDVLRDLRAQFPRHIFNCPINFSDKELGKFSDIATPTAEFKLSDENYAQKIELMGEEYEKIYQNFFPEKKRKVVIKPKDLAQSLGVFALDLAKEKDVKKACIEHGEELYREQILVQPFLEGVRQGDIRATIIKNEESDFECAGYTFRKSLRSAESEDFTTGYIVGGSTPRPILDLTKNEQEDLQKKCEKVLYVLNGELREKYRDVIELGADFILVGNGHQVFLGEINHNCPGLVPVSEAMGDEKKYEGGLGIVKRLIEISTRGLPS